jgi:large repetitive protein
MKLKNYLLLATLFFFGCTTFFAQVKVPFTSPSGSLKVKGDLILIGNQILNRTRTKTKAIFANPQPADGVLYTAAPTNLATLTSEANTPYNTLGIPNDGLNAEYIDIDSDPSTFSSSSATLTFPNSSITNCKTIKYAALYWAAIYANDRSTNSASNSEGTQRFTDFNKMKLKLPNATNYIDITADRVIFDDGASPHEFITAPYVCFKDVTTLLQNLKDASGANIAEGVYTAANIRAERGQKYNGSTGGWTLVVVYENQFATSRYISVFDGFANIFSGQAPVNIKVNGFTTLPAPYNVNASVGFSSLEGEQGIPGDQLLINKYLPAPVTPFTNLTNNLNPVDDVFNASITSPIAQNSPTVGYTPGRTPSCDNTLGYDIDLMNPINTGNKVITNDETGATLQLQTDQDTFSVFLATFAVDVIEPKIFLSKKVFDTAGANASNANVILGQQLNYELEFQSTGNDDVKNYTIKDVLPKNVIFNYPADIVTLPAGMTIAGNTSYNAVTREITFTIPDALVKKPIGDPLVFIPYKIRFRVQVVPDCNQLTDACSNLIQNKGFSTYTGYTNTTVFSDESFSNLSSCSIGGDATNFLVKVPGCPFGVPVTLCGTSTSITAANGYDVYTWTGPGGFTATGQTITVTVPGNYVVSATPKPPCIQSLNQTVIVSLKDPTGAQNPILNYVDATNTDPKKLGQIAVCGVNGKLLPKIFLCGANDFRDLTITTAGVTVDWYKIKTGACTTTADNSPLCANEDPNCWTKFLTNATYRAQDAGHYKLVVNYPLGGCSLEYYFDVFTNILTPGETHKDIFCKNGEMVATGVPLVGYEFSLNYYPPAGPVVSSTYGASNIFVITTPGSYDISIRQLGIPNGCVFKTPNALIVKHTPSIKTSIIQPKCFGDKGLVTINAIDIKDPYTYTIEPLGGGTPLQTLGPIVSASSVPPFSVNPGKYTVRIVSTDPVVGCNLTQDIDVTNITQLKVTANLTKPLTACSDGEITVNATGGTPPYNYYSNGVLLASNIIPVVAPGGTYTIDVVDFNNCPKVTVVKVVSNNPKPTYAFTTKPVKCYTDKDGEIHFTNVVNPSNYVIEYSIDNGGTYQSSPDFLGLTAGNFYQLVIRYSFPATGTTAAATCIDTAKPVTVAGPNFALTASAGVAELAGCGVAPNPTNFGKVRITNVQGGTPPYTYSFDNQATWIASNEAYVAPNPTGYTLYVKDAVGCIFPMPGIKLDFPPLPPTIDVTSPTFACDGKATVTATVTSPVNVNYDFKYYLDGVLNTGPTPNVFTSISTPPSTRTVSVEYVLKSAATPSILLNENFGYGSDTFSPGINTTYYCLERQQASLATACNTGTTAINDGEYSVTSKIVTPFSAWLSPNDHTAPTVPPTPKGRYLVVNIGAAIPKTAVLYEQTIKDIIPTQPINFEFYAMNLLRANNGNTQFPPDLIVALVDASGTEISSFFTGNIPQTLGPDGWIKYPTTPITLDPKGNTTLKFIVRSNVQQTSGNDVAIDDIKVFQLPKSCITKTDFPVTIPTNQAFTATLNNFTSQSCVGVKDGGFTITAQNFAPTGYFYRIDEGALPGTVVPGTWIKTTVSPLVINNLDAGPKTVFVSYDGLASATCQIPFTPTVPPAVALVVNASVTVPATCIKGATVVAKAIGGTPAYEFQLKNKASSAIILPISQFSDTFIDVPPGTYIVTGKDSSKCTDDADTDFVVAPAATFIASLDPTTKFCYDAINGATLVVKTDKPLATYTYSLDGVLPGKASATFTGVGVGLHTIIVTDSNTGCTSTVTADIKPELKVSITTTQLDCGANPKATISGTIVGGTAPYTVTILQGAGGTLTQTGATFTYTNAVAGDYQFQVEDATGTVLTQHCKATSNVATVNVLTNPTLTATPTNPKCFGDANGSIQLNPAGGSGVYISYVITAPASATGNVTGATTGLFTGLSANILYTFQVKDSKGCPGTVQVTLTQPTQLAISATATAFKCDVTNVKQTATITIDVPTTGTGPYTYSFDDVAYSGTRTLTINDTGVDQTIRYYVKDANKCPTSDKIIVPKLNPVTKGSINGSTITCKTGETTGTITLVPGTGTATSYVITSGTTINTTGATSGIFTGLLPGLYTFKVSDDPTKGCFYTDSFDLKPVAPVTAGVSSFTNATCNGASDGKIVFTVGGNPGAFTYVLKNNAGATIPIGQSTVAGTAITYTGLPQDPKYTLTVTNPATGCTATASQIITEPTKLVFAVPTATKLTCITPSISTITVVAPTTGTPTYTYAAVVTGAAAPLAGAYAATNPFTVNTTTGANLVWDVYVKDANGCTTKQTVTIIQDALPVITTPPAPVCYTGTPFNITFSGTGIAPLSYGINGSYQALPYSVTAPGTYVLTIKDGNGCISAPVNYVVNKQIKLTATLDRDLRCNPPGPVDAQITLTTTDAIGAVTYGYSTTGVAGPYTPMGTNVLNIPSIVGATENYVFRVIDANTCPAISNVITVTKPLPVLGSTIDKNPTCNGYKDGSITINASGGEPGYTYSFNGSAFTTTKVYGGLIAGSYSYIIKDKKGCTFSATVGLTDPPAITPTITGIPIACSLLGPILGSIDVAIPIGSGGTPPFTYTLFDSAFNPIGAPFVENGAVPTATHNFPNLNFGNYYVTIVDKNGCEYKSPSAIKIQPPPYADLDIQTAGGSCPTGPTVTIKVTGGTPNYTYYVLINGVLSLSSGSIPATTYTFTTGLKHGLTYTFVVIDSKGCPSYKEITTPTLSTIKLNLGIPTDVTCKNAANGTLPFTVENYIGTLLKYEVLDDLTNSPIVPPKFGTITGLSGAITPIETITGLKPGNYTLFIQEDVPTECTTSGKFQIREPLQSLTSVVDSEINANCNKGPQVVIKATGGTQPYYYAFVKHLDPSPTYPIDYSTANFMELPIAGGLDWDIYVKDANGCDAPVLNHVFLKDPSPILKPLVITDKCAKEGLFEIVVDLATAGVPPYYISVDNGAFMQIAGVPFSATGLNSGLHEVIIKDANDCSSPKESITITPTPLADAKVTKNLDCSVTPGATIRVTITNGKDPFSYTVNKNGALIGGITILGAGVTFFDYPVATAVAGDYYEFVITDSNLCPITTNKVFVNPLVPLVDKTTKVDPLCNGGTGTVTLAATGGEGAYTYSFDGSLYTSTNTYPALAGSHTYNIKDALDCTLPGAPSIVVGQPTALAEVPPVIVKLSCGVGNVAQDAKVTLQGTAGTPPYEYSFNVGAGFSTQNVYTVIDTGANQSIPYKIRDKNLCEISGTVDIFKLDPPKIVSVVPSPILCLPLASTTSTAVITITNGVGAPTYTILSGPTINATGVATGTFTGLTAGDYVFEVKDTNGCTDKKAITIAPVKNIDLQILSQSDVKCNGAKNGTASFTVSGFSGTYSYTVSSLVAANSAGLGAVLQSATTINLGGTATALAPDTYTVTVTDDVTGCTATQTITIAEPTPVTLALDPTVDANVNANCNVGAKVTVIASGGTPGYLYSFVQDNQPAGPFTASATAILDPAFVWDAWVQDANLCTFKLDLIIVKDAPPTIKVIASQCVSPTGYTIEVEVKTGIGTTFDYSIGTGFVSDGLSHTFTVNTDGNYNVTVRDKNGCIVEDKTIKIATPLLLEATISNPAKCFDADGEVTLTASGGSGNYEYSKDNVVFLPSPVFGLLAPSATPYTFYVKDKTTSCVTPVQKLIELPALITGLTVKAFPASCKDSNDGRIEATIDPSTATANFDPPYTYDISPIPTSAYVQNGGTFTNVAPLAGGYTITVKSGRRCEDSKTVIVTEPNAIIVTPVVTQYGCSMDNTTDFAKITVTNVMGGNNVFPNYTYEFIKVGTPNIVVSPRGSNPEYIETDLLGGDYIINVYDDKNCSEMTTAKIDKFIDLDKITVAVTTPIICGGKEDIAITVKSKDGTLLSSPAVNLEYKVVDINPTTGVEGANYNPPANSTGVFSGLLGLGIGQYKVTVTNKTTNCFVQTIHTVNDPNTFELVASAITNLYCFGDTNGSVKITMVDKFSPPDDAGPFTYTLTSNNPFFVTRTNVSSTGVTADIADLIRGIYTIKAKLNSGTECPVETTFTIEGPPEKLVLTTSIGVVTCTPGADGMISASATGGWPGGYEYKLDGTATVAYSANGEFKGLSAGTYTVTVKDVSGCEDPITIDLKAPTPIAVNAIADKAKVNCTGDKSATITATVTSGNGDYLYTLNTTSATPPTTDGPYPSGVFTTLGKGTYTVTVTDKLGCDGTSAPVTIDEPTTVIAKLDLDTKATCKIDGKVKLTAQGGQSPYTYSADGVAYNPATFVSSVVINAPVSATPYQYYVKDALGCVSPISNAISILKPEDIVINIEDYNPFISCNGDNKGVIVARATGGLGNYVYALSDVNGVVLNPQPGKQLSEGRFTDLRVGDYYVKVVSSDCEEISGIISIKEPLFPITAKAIPTPITCSGDANGMITVEASGGTGVIKYAIAPLLDQFFDTNVFKKLAKGFYDVLAQDEKGCFILMTNIEITEPDPLVVDVVAGTVVQEKCYGDKNAAFSIRIEGGTPPYTATLDQDPTTTKTGTLAQTQFDFANIAGGEHVVSIVDANGCPTEFREILDVAKDIAPQITIDYGCPTIAEPLLNTVIVTVNPDLNAGDLTYMLDGVPYVATNVYLPNNGIFSNVAVGKHKVLVKHKDGCEQLTTEFEIDKIEPISVLLTQGGLNEIVATVTGGAGGNHFTFNGEDNGSNNKYIYYHSGNYTVEVIDAHGCKATDTKPFEFIDIEVPEIFTPNGDGNNDGWRPNKTENYPDLIYYIFDRYGRKLGTFSQPESWDGKYDGKELPTGDYWYALKLRNVKDEREFVGHFMLYR